MPSRSRSTAAVSERGTSSSGALGVCAGQGQYLPLCEAAERATVCSYGRASSQTLVSTCGNQELIRHHDHVSHDDNLRRLNGKFAVAHRYANFGPVLQSLEIRGFRGITDLTLTVQSPITALSGLNGTGKSTIAQWPAADIARP